MSEIDKLEISQGQGSYPRVDLTVAAQIAALSGFFKARQKPEVAEPEPSCGQSELPDEAESPERADMVEQLHEFAESTDQVFRVGHQGIMNYFSELPDWESKDDESLAAIDRGIVMFEALVPFVCANWVHDVTGATAEVATRQVLNELRAKRITPAGQVMEFEVNMQRTTKVIATDFDDIRDRYKFAVLGAAVQQRIALVALERQAIAAADELTPDIFLRE